MEKKFVVPELSSTKKNLALLAWFLDAIEEEGIKHDSPDESVVMSRTKTQRNREKRKRKKK
nr:MAG TPA: hypothetical protein [Caudoviricetes sp.]